MCRAFFTLLIGTATVLAAFAVSAKNANQVFEQVSPSVVVVLSLDVNREPIALGSGVTIQGGMVATNCHVIEDGALLVVKADDHNSQARLRYKNTLHDICILIADGLHTPPATFGNSAGAKVGDSVFAVGAPEGLELSLSEGIISGFRNTGSERYIQTTAAISHGSSGGGLFDDEGRLLGLTSFYISGGQQLNFALPVEWITAFPLNGTPHRLTANEEDKWVKRIASLGNTTDWHALKALSKQWIDAEPDSLYAWNAFYLASSKLGQRTDMVTAIEHLLQIDPTTAISILGSNADDYFSDGKYEDAIKASKEVLQIDPQDWLTWTNLGYDYEQIDQHSKAIGAYMQAVRVFDTSDDLSKVIKALKQPPPYKLFDVENPWTDLFLSYLAHGERAQAIKACKKLASISTELAAYEWHIISKSPPCYLK